MTDQELEAIGESVGLGPNISKEYGRALLARAIPDGHVVVPGWQPIESAPKDGQRILSWRAHAVYPTIVGWDSDYAEWEDLYGDHIYHLTHWMPLPAAPAPEGEA